MDDELVDLLTRDVHSEAQWERMVGLLEGLSSARQAHVWSQVVNRVAERPPPIVGDVSQDQWLKLCLGKVKKTYMGALSDATPAAISMPSAPAAAPDSGLRARVEALEQRLNALGTEARTDEASANRIKELEGQLAELRAQLNEEKRIFVTQIQALKKNNEAYVAEKEGLEKALVEATAATDQHRREAEAATAQADAAKADADAAKAAADAAKAEVQATAAAAQADASTGSAAQAQLETAMSDLRTKIAKLEAEADDLRAKLAASEQAHSDGAASKDQEVVELTKKLKEAEDNIADLKQHGGETLEQLDHAIRDKAIEREELTKRLEDTERLMAKAEEDHRAQVAAMEAKVKELESSVDDLTKNMAAKEAEIRDEFENEMEAVRKDRDHEHSRAENIENDLYRLRALYDKMQKDNDPTAAIKLTETEAKLKESEDLLKAANEKSARLSSTLEELKESQATTLSELKESQDTVAKLNAQVKVQAAMDADELPKVDQAKLQDMLDILWEPTTTFQAHMQRSHIDKIKKPFLKEFKVQDTNASGITKPEVPIDFTEVLIDPSIIAAFTDALNQYVAVWQSNAKWTSDSNEKLLTGYKGLVKAPISKNPWLFQVQEKNLFINSNVIGGIFYNIENYINPQKRNAKPPSGAPTEKFMAKLRLEHVLEEDVTYIGKLKSDISYVPAYFVLLGLSVMPSIVHEKKNVTWRFPSLPPSQISMARSRKYTYMDGLGKFKFSNAFMKVIENDMYVPASYDDLKAMMYPTAAPPAPKSGSKEQFNPDNFFLNFNLP